MNAKCQFCGKPVGDNDVSCPACQFTMSRGLQGSPEPAVEQKIAESDSDKAASREQEIAADVFNPAESDMDYFLRRKRELGL